MNPWKQRSAQAGAVRRRLAAAAVLGVLLPLGGITTPPAAAQVAERSGWSSFYEGTLPFFYDLYTFRGDDRGTVVVASFAVRSGQLRARRAGGRVLYRFDVTLVLADTAAGTVMRTDDSVYVAWTRPLSGDHLLYTQIETLASPATGTVQRVVMTDASTPGAGQLYETAFPVPDYSGTALMLSDIALAEPADEGGWRRGDVMLALLPTSQFPASSFDVYYEIYNLPYGTLYTTEVAVQRLRRDGRPAAEDPVGLRFTGEAAPLADGSLRELRRVDAELVPGRYRLTVTVRDEATGATAARSRTFRVRGWEPGTTLVPARPRSP